MKIEENSIIACLDIQNGRTVKGTRFVDITDAGEPETMAANYCRDGVDELIFLDISATIEKRPVFFDLVSRLAAVTTVPFTVGGGISQLSDMETLFRSGASRISINTAAFRNPNLITQAANRFGSEKITVAIDTRKQGEKWLVALSGGKQVTDTLVLEWAQQAREAGAGSLLLTSMEHDGTGKGFALELTRDVGNAVTIPVIASGGAGTKEHFREVFEKTAARAALGAGVFHRNEIRISELKKWLQASI